MPVRGLRRGATIIGEATDTHAPIYIDSDDNILKVIPAGTGTTEVQVVDASSTQTLTNKTLTSPTITGATLSTATLSAPTITGNPTGIVKVAGGTITELDGDATYSISVTLPAGAVLLNFVITGIALWTAGTSATLIVGDTADPDGFFTGVNAKTTPAVGTSLTPDTVPGGTGDGAYLGDTNGEFVGPASANFGRVYTAGSIITATVTKVGTGTAGRTGFHVFYALPEAVAQVVA
jgi:hypothetical protein